MDVMAHQIIIEIERKFGLLLVSQHFFVNVLLLTADYSLQNPTVANLRKTPL